MTQVLVVLWFDTEDFVNPESDEIPLRIANMMEKHGIKVVFKIVGEKLRGLRKRNRTDVIDAMSRHDIGYHTNLHSIHPIMSEYVDDLPWDEGAAEFEKNERIGYDDLMNTFGRVTCFGQPGLSWVPQAYPVLKDKWKIPVYLDETFTLGSVNDRPFWYCNMLNLMCLRNNVMSLDACGPYNPTGERLLTLPDEFDNIYQRLRSDDEVGLISIFCHPTTYATKEFWDQVNYSKGANPRNSPLTVPIKSSQEIERDLAHLEKLVIHMKSKPDVRFITSEDALSIYHDATGGMRVSSSELRKLCEKSTRGITYQTLDNGVWFSAAEVFSMVLFALSQYASEGTLPDSIISSRPLGPKEKCETATDGNKLDLRDFLESSVSEYGEENRTGYLSSSVKIKGSSLSPADMFATCCIVYSILFDARGTDPPKSVMIQRGNFEVGYTVTEEGAKKDWKYYLSPDNFEAYEQVKLARLQTWTLKPASVDVFRLH